MAEVFLARRRVGHAEKLLVVKRIRAERLGDTRFRESFSREAHLSMGLTHQNIVQVFDYGKAGEQVFLAMERVEGRDLGSTLARSDRRPPPPLVAAFIAAGCCQALDYAHGRRRDGTSLGIVHRDVTPRNVLLSWSGEVKLTDFGIAALAGDDTSRLVGTPGYMAPEQARGETLDVRTDIYGVGMVLREALTGVRARPGEDRETLLAAARTGELAPWQTEPPSELMAIADRATAANPEERYASAHEMLVDLDAYIVAERATHLGDPPSRQLASWLGEVWGDDRDVGEDQLRDGDSAELLSFLDDGGLDAMGTGTQRSLLATAADESLAAEVLADDEAPPTARSEPAASTESPTTKEPAKAAVARAESDAKRPKLDPGARPRTTKIKLAKRPTDRERKRSTAWLAPVLVVIVSIILVVAIVHKKRKPPAFQANNVAANGNSAASGSGVVGSGSDPSGAVGSGSGSTAGRVTDGSDSAGSASGSDAGSATNGNDAGSATGSDGNAAGSDTNTGSAAGSADPNDRGSAAVVVPPRNLRHVVRPPHAGSGTHHAGSATPRAGSGSNAGSAAPPPGVLRKVRINATPWAYFTVDGKGPRYQTPRLVELTPGKHTIHFENEFLKVDRDITLDVPADRDISYVEPLGH